MSYLILHNEKYIILLYNIEIFWKHGGPEKKNGHEKVTRSCIPPHGFFKEELGLTSINSSQKTSNCEEKNPWGVIHDLVTFAKCGQNDFCEKNLLKMLRNYKFYFGDQPKIISLDHSQCQLKNHNRDTILLIM